MTAAQLSVLGVGQTWQDVTASRATNTTYTNSTTTPICVHIYCVGSGVMNVVIDAINIGGFQANASAVNGSGTFIVPSGSTYRLNGSATLFKWSELRA